MSASPDFDVAIVGSGAAGLSLALTLAQHCSVVVITKAVLRESATLYAQGGISAVLDNADSVESHVADTLDAGAGLCRRDVVEFIVSRGRERIEWLLSQGVNFTTERDASGQESFHLTREGGHSHRRVVHAADATGREIETTLEERVRENESITVLEKSSGTGSHH